MRFGRRALLMTSLAWLATTTSGCTWTSTRAVSAPEAWRALEAARSRIGDPYRWGGQGPGGFDCSGLILWAYGQALGTLRLRRPDGRLVSDATMHEIFTHHAIRLSPAEAWPGDIVAIAEDGGTIATHRGLVERVEADRVWFVNASSHHGRVVPDVWPLAASKRAQYVLGFGRLVVAERRLWGIILSLPLAKLP